MNKKSHFNIIDETVKLYFDYGISVQEALKWALEMEGNNANQN